MNYENYLERWHNLSSVLLDIKTVIAVGDSRFLAATRSSPLQYPALLINEPQVQYAGIDSRIWHCEILLVDKHTGTHTSEDATMQETFRIISNIIFLANTPTEIGFAESHELRNFKAVPATTGADQAIGWKLSFELRDHSALCLDIDVMGELPGSIDHVYESDTAAKAANLTTGSTYYLSDNNRYGLPGGIPKRITE